MSSAQVTESILPVSEPETDSPPKSTPPPLVDSFGGFVSYLFTFFIFITIWFVAGVAWYDLLTSNEMFFTFMYGVWALPLLGLISAVLSGGSTVGWTGSITVGTIFILSIQALRVLFFGFDLKKSSLAAWIPTPPSPAGVPQSS